MPGIVARFSGIVVHDSDNDSFSSHDTGCTNTRIKRRTNWTMLMVMIITSVISISMRLS